ncbi:hypothetical protein FRAHR75_450030 [Frankia sp. Hr75.2]|nr:hypothetical protein FRAHR75_450030 [Frankia sp. Hr75.2]SQD98731.1 hypothetical protein FMEAI12_4870024 [Parafrankia sp. Ea1.12]
MPAGHVTASGRVELPIPAGFPPPALPAGRLARVRRAGHVGWVGCLGRAEGAD